MNIYLVGFMATGKSSVGKELAKKKKLQFVDLDDLIELKEKRVISDIFAKSGEPYFRKVEKRVLKEISARKSSVVACGGGIVMDEDNIRLMKETGVVICLTATPQVILKRTSTCTHRPLLNVKEPKKQISQLLKLRAPYYAKARKTIDTSKLSVKEVVSKILKLVSPEDMTRFKALVGLNMFCGIGSARLKKLLDIFGAPENILKAPADKLASVFGIGGNTALKIASLKEEDIDAELKLAEKYNLNIIAIGDDIYPENLKHIPDPPLVLYVKGELKEEDRLSIAIVGSRRASFYGISSAERFAGDLVNRGFTVVSGLARGIDTASHKGALKERGRTIAVIGSGFHYIYPPENKKLAEEISRYGAVISEFPIQARPLPENFPRRNRIISGLSLGVLVVEAARNSGALITVDCALEQGRDVFALPGKIDSGNSFGTNEMIKQGAKLVSCADDIAEEFNLPLVLTTAEHKIKEPADPDGKAALSDNESLLYNLIQGEPLLMDDIVERSGLDITRISGILLNLELRRLVKEMPGKQFIRMMSII